MVCRSTRSLSRSRKRGRLAPTRHFIGHLAQRGALKLYEIPMRKILLSRPTRGCAAWGETNTRFLRLPESGSAPSVVNTSFALQEGDQLPDYRRCSAGMTPFGAG